MVELYCTPFAELIERMKLEFATQQSMFDLPQRKWFTPPTEESGIDLSVSFHDQKAGNAVGPASGPQTQMAQNLVLSWLAGSRIMELKTVQINDQLEISRPCIDAANVGYNVEWSQELLVHESLDQYVQGAMLIHMLRNCPQTFGNPFGDVDHSGLSGETIFDMSVGYDLAGIQSEKVGNFIRSMMDATEEIDRLRNEIPAHYPELRELDYPTNLSRGITLSTFHGCPADEIERICEYLITEFGVHVIVKMNPPMLGKEHLEHLLYDVMGYHDLKVNPSAYTSGLLFDQSLEMSGRLSRLAESKNVGYGAKFSNTLEVINHRDFFVPEEKVMYLSGQPLHVITLTLAHKFREAVGANMPITFSAGVDRRNFANMVASGFVPITTCTDLLKTGGYGRLSPYLGDLQKAMGQVDAKTIDDYILDCRGQREVSGGNVAEASLKNLELIVQETQADNRYYAEKNSKSPNKIDSHLVTFDCITCDKCIPVCPNDANFAYVSGEVDLTYFDLEVAADGSISPQGEEKKFTVEKQSQIANFGDYCNHCGNCDTFCPEYDGPYLKKPTFFGSEKSYVEGMPHDGFFLSQDEQSLTLKGRINGQEHQLSKETSANNYTYFDGIVSLRIEEESPITLADSTPSPAETHLVDMGFFHTLVTLLSGITDTSRVHAINAPLAASAKDA